MKTKETKSRDVSTCRLANNEMINAKDFLPHPISQTASFPALCFMSVSAGVFLFNFSPYLVFAVIIISPFWFLRAYFNFRRAKLSNEMFLFGMLAEYFQITLPPLFAGILSTGAVSIGWFSNSTGEIEKLFYYGLLIAGYYLSHEAILNRKQTFLYSPAGMAKGFLSAYVQFFSNLLILITLPIIFGIGAYYSTNLYLGTNQIFSFFCAVVSAGVSYSIIFRYFSLIQSKVTRGQEEGTHDEAKEKLDKIRSPKDAGILFGGVRLPSEAATGHFLAVGTTGSGKTVAIKLLMESVLRFIFKAQDHRAIMFDAKRELYAYLQCKMGFDSSHIHTLNPFDQRGAALDFSKDFNTEAQAVELANALIPPPEKEGDNAYFGKAARRITTGIIYSLILTSDEREARGEERITWTLRDLILALRYEESIRYLLSKHEETRYLIKKYFRNEKTVNDVLSTLDTSISDFNVVAALWEHAPYKISLRDWAYNRKGSVILLGWDKEHKKSLDPINRVIFQRLSDILINQSNSATRRTWIFLDELREISGGLPGLTQLLNMGREKGHCCVLGVLDIKGLMSALGENNAQEITGLCDNVAALRTRSAPTATWLSDMFGNAEIQEQNLSRDSQGKHSIQQHITERKVFLSGQFQKLEKPSKENQFTIGGYYLNAYTKPFQYNFPGINGWQKLVPRLTEDEINQYGIIPRKRAKHKLRLWDKNDLERLEIDLDINFLLEREVSHEQKQPIATPKFRLVENEF